MTKKELQERFLEAMDSYEIGFDDLLHILEDEVKEDMEESKND